MASVFAGRCANTPSCWEIHGAFTVIFLPHASLYRFRGRKGVCIRDFTVSIRYARIKQAYLKEYLQIFVSDDEAPILVDYHEILAITNEEGAVWE